MANKFPGACAAQPILDWRTGCGLMRSRASQSTPTCWSDLLVVVIVGVRASPQVRGRVSRRLHRPLCKVPFSFQIFLKSIIHFNFFYLYYFSTRFSRLINSILTVFFLSKRTLRLCDRPLQHPSARHRGEAGHGDASRIESLSSSLLLQG